MKKFIILTVVLAFILPFVSLAGEPPKPLWTAKNPFEQKVFIENAGQYFLKKKASAAEILFGARQDGAQYFFTKDGLFIKRFDRVERTKREIERFKKNIGEDEKDIDGEEKKDNLVKYKFVERFHQMKFVGANQSTTIVSEDQVSQTFNFGGDNKINLKGFTAHGFKKITYKNLYPGIDMEFVFPEDKQGFKYTFIAHPGADASVIKISYPLNEGINLDSKGNVVINSTFGDFTDHAPVANEFKSIKNIDCSFSLNSGTVKFTIGNYDKTKTLVIDPWTTTPILAGSNNAYDVDWDKYGNCYAYGGNSPFVLAKFNSTGVQMWQYTNNFASTGGGFYYGDFAVNRATGSAFVIDGFNGSGANAEKINLAGGFAVASISNSNFQEMWRIVYSRCTNQVVIAGGGTTSPSFTGATFDTSLSAGSLQIANVINSPGGLHDMWGVAIDAFGSAYFATAKTQVGTPGYDNYIFKVLTPALVPITYSVATTYSFVEVASVTYAGFSSPNGFNGMAMSNTTFYTYDSYNLHKWNSVTGTTTGTAAINGASLSSMTYGGLTADECDHVFLGLNNTIKQYNGVSMTQVASFPAAGTVYDCFLGQGNILYSCGAGFVSAMNVALPPCTILQVSDSITNGTCTNPVGSATLTVTGGTAPYVINWNTTPPQNGLVITGVPTGTYIATITDNSCPPLTTQDTVVITSNAGVVVSSSVKDISCFGGTNGAITLTVTPTGTIVPTYTWSTGGLTQNISNVPAGIYTLTIGTGGPCNMTLVYTIIEPPPLSYTVSPGIINCFGDTTSIKVSVNGGTPKNTAPVYSVTWGPPVATGYVVHGLGVGNYGGTIQDSMGCVATYTTLLTQPPQIAVSYTLTSGCLGTPVKFTDQSSGGPFSYNWNYGDGSGAGVTQNPQHTYLAPGTYTTALIVTNSNGCKDTLKRTLTVDAPPQAAFTGDTLTGCPTHDVVFKDNSTSPVGSSITNWLWDFGNGTTSVSQFPTAVYYTNTSATTNSNYMVTLTVVNNKGCTATVTKNNYVIVYPRPIAGFTYSSDDGSQLDLFNNNVHFYTTATGATQYSWDLGDLFATPSYSVNYSSNPNPVHQYLNDGAYTYYASQVVSNQYGCKDSVTMPIPIRPIYTFYAPNSFSPNGDGVNEGFKGQGYGIDNTTYKMIIFDRWGNLIFTSNDIDKAWDGRPFAKGDVGIEDIYVWKVSFADVLGLKHEVHGIVSLVK